MVVPACFIKCQKMLQDFDWQQQTGRELHKKLPVPVKNQLNYSIVNLRRCSIFPHCAFEMPSFQSHLCRCHFMSQLIQFDLSVIVIWQLKSNSRCLLLSVTNITRVAIIVI